MTDNKKTIMAKAEGVTKNFSLYANQSEKLKSVFKGNRAESNFWALRGLSFEVETGDVVGIVGTNGSGKSTLLNILSGVIPQTSGNLTLNGTIGVVAINEGLNWELTGRENIRLKQIMMRNNMKQINEMMDDIIDFSELGDFIDQPVKDYSSGMRAKLGFSIVTHNDPDILIIDEALSVGDSNFANKALGKIQEFIAKGKTIFFVSHDLKQVRKFTNKVMWIQYGEMLDYGPTEEVADEYAAFVKRLDKMDVQERDAYVEAEKAKQRSFSVDDLQKTLRTDGYDDDEIREITRSRSFEGFSRFSLYGSLLIVILLMAYIVYRFVNGG